jgi:hypothetical protein
MTAVSCFGGRSRLPPAPGDRQLVLRSRNRDAREQMFAQAKALHASGKSFVAIAAEIGIGRGTIANWIEADSLPDRRRVTLKPTFLPADGRRATRSAVDYFTTSGIAATWAAVPIWSAFFLNGGAWSVLGRAGGESRQERSALSIQRQAGKSPHSSRPLFA